MKASAPAPATFDPERFAVALHPLSATPPGPGWNHDELIDLLPAGTGRAAAVLIGLVPRPSGIQVLLTRRTEGLRHHPGQVSFPGGRIEPGDRDTVAAAVRETGEELGIDASLITPLGFLDPLATVTGFRVVPVVAHLCPSYAVMPDPGEVAEAFEVPLDFLLDPANLEARPFEWKGRTRRIWEYRYPAQRIWGATASMLLNLRHRLEAAR